MKVRSLCILTVAAILVPLSFARGDVPADCLPPANDPKWFTNPASELAVKNSAAAPTPPEHDSRTIREGDDLQINIDDLEGPGITTTVTPRVDAHGNIDLPYIHKVKAEGLTLCGLEEAIARAYADALRMAHAKVNVRFAKQGPATRK